jgi:hypothetical protein
VDLRVAKQVAFVLIKMCCAEAKFRLENPLTCSAGYNCDLTTLGAGANAALVYGCCIITSSCSTFYTGCFNYQAVFSSSPSVLTW